MTLANEAYDQFQKQTRSILNLPYDELPPLYQDAWRDVVKLVVSRAVEVVRELGTTGEAAEVDQEYSPNDLLTLAAKVVEGIAK